MAAITLASVNSLTNTLIKGLAPLINKLARRATNAVVDQDDAVQEIHLRIFEYVNKNVGSEKSVDDLLREGTTVIRNFTSSFISYQAARPDTSIYRAELEGVAETVSSKAANQFQEASAENLVEKLMVRLAEDKKAGADLVAYVSNCINPSPEVLAYYFKWREEASASNPHVNRGIPPRVIGGALGFDGTKVSRLQRKVASILKELGVGLHEIFGNKFCEGQSEAWFQSYGIGKEEWRRERDLDFVLDSADRVRMNRNGGMNGLVSQPVGNFA